MGNPRADVLLALEEVLCAREEVRSATGARRPEPLPPHLPDLETQIIELVRADRSRTTAVLQQAIDQLEQLDARMSRSEERAREAEELLQHLYKCAEAQNEAKDMLGQLYRRIEAQLTGKSNRYARGASYRRSAA